MATNTPAPLPPAPSEASQLAAYYAEHSMLHAADKYAAEVSGNKEQWHGPYLSPEPETLTRQAADYLTLYPRSYLPLPGKSVLATMADPALWDALSQLGITLVHPLTYERAGRVVGRDQVAPSVDGGFDRISYEVEPSLGSEADIKALARVAAEHGAQLVGDVIPLHSGLGYDFRLAEMGVAPYAGLYELIEIAEADWGLLPAVDDPWGVKVITRDRAEPLIAKGYMPGRIEVLVGSEESVTWSGWAATGRVTGEDGKARRWIYAHLFEAEQPKYNWIDPSYAGRRSQAGDLVHQIVKLGVRVQRLDAVPFLGLEPSKQRDASMKHYMTSLAIAGTNDLAYTARKLGGWTWVELNVPVQPYLQFMENGADLGYDFFTRAETLHPLISSDARILRQAHRALLDAGVPHSALIHSLQNHDEITYQLVDLRARKDGAEQADRVLQEAQRAVAGAKAPYNLLYRPQHDGLATTYAGFIAPALGIADPYHATPEQLAAIKQAHVLLAHVSALQPGVFSLSQWDLVGALPLARAAIADRLTGGDVRWLNRGAVDLVGGAASDKTPLGLPQAQALYGALPAQLRDPQSFASQVAGMIRARKTYGIARAKLLQVPELANAALFALVMRLPDEVGGVAVTVANYGRQPLTAAVPVRGSASGAPPVDALTGEQVGTVRGETLSLPVAPLSARTVVLRAAR